MRYEDMVRRICGEDWKEVNSNERDGGFGVACVIAFLRGTKPSVGDLANSLGVHPDDIIQPFNRLNRNGVFSSRFNARRDRDLGGHLANQDTEIAWCFIAGIAGGLTGV